MKHYSIVSKSGEEIASDLTPECKVCMTLCDSIGTVINTCPNDRMKRRQGIISNNRGVTFLCCDETKTTKLFRYKLEGLSYAYYDLIMPVQKYEANAKKNEQQRVNRLVHNLTSINAHNIQEIYDLVPQELLASNYNTQLIYIQKEIKKNVKKACLLFLRIAKHNIHMKTEFSIYKRMDRSDARLEFRPHPIQKVLMNVLHTFFVDFSNNDIFIDVKNYFGKVSIDYETIQVALYHLIENASKYTKPHTTILIEFTENHLNVDVRFEMTSLFIEVDEIEKILIEGYSGKAANQSGLNGDGIGMWRINQMMILNKGSVIINPGKTKIICENMVYGTNQITLRFIKV